MEQQTFQDIDSYISKFPEDIGIILNQIRHCIHKAAPTARETISYNMPSFKQNNKILVYFAAFKNHIGFYALPSGNKEFQKELSQYKTGKGSIQFPLGSDLPYELIGKIVHFRIREVENN